jgi:hypothetical protein
MSKQKQLTSNVFFVSQMHASLIHKIGTYIHIDD